MYFLHVSALAVPNVSLSLVSQNHLQLPTETAVLRGSERTLRVFLLPLRAAGTGLGLPELPSVLRAKAEIVSGGAKGCDLVNDVGNSCVIVTKWNRMFGFLNSL